ncbi:unnamed protein product, partial [Rotaria sp. Silwood1]
MFKQILCQIFSNQCQLTSLQLDITKLSYEIHQSLNSHSYVSINKISNEFPSYCITLRHLYIHLNHICFLEHLIEYVSNLEQLSVHFHNSLIDKYYRNSNINILKLSNKIGLINRYIWKSVIDANFIRQYCLPDQIINLKYFYFYICAKRQSSLNNISEIINSFKINSFFISHQWTNVQCFYDENTSKQHIFSSNLKKFQHSILLFKHSYIYEWSNIEHIQNSIHPSFYLFLKQFDELCPNVSSMAIDI